jgi:hypothetical protein
MVGGGANRKQRKSTSENFTKISSPSKFVLRAQTDAYFSSATVRRARKRAATESLKTKHKLNQSNQSTFILMKINLKYNLTII